eukprot:TRINITY_DN35998_c0_g1_i1.p1 TRINITY_DN35998_c0_g1~~TRINITY_DN35998_c0_g1_i1.p1  ORF type:complete len:548 (-),score=87.59 TRINITY_DN35998_c0_g1_i1:132-1775(-)
MRTACLGSNTRLILTILISVLIAVASSENPRRPHIIFIVADDLGWNDVGFRSGQIKTPNIDGLARDGLVLDGYYVQSVCSPSRAAFMTGRLPLHNTVNDWLVPGKAEALPLNETLMPEILKKAGYTSHATGKWHLGFHKWAHTPTFRGFDSFVGFYTGGEDYFTHKCSGRFDLRRDMSPRCGKACSQVSWQDVGRYSTHLYTEEASRVIAGFDSASGPLFLYLAYQATHSPGQVPSSYADAYNGTIKDEKRRVFAGMLSCLDEGIGNVTRALKQKGMLENTIIVFTTDNGGPIGVVGGDFVGSENYPLRGGKHSIWEGGTRGTAVLWAGRDARVLPEAKRGTTVQNLMHGVDWLPTFCSIAGLQKQFCQPHSGAALDGVDQSGPLFRGEADVRDEVYYGRHDDAPEKFSPFDGALRDGSGWKLVQNWGGQPDIWSKPTNVSHSSHQQSDVQETLQQHATPMLFNLADDPNEHTDVADQHPDVVARLSQRLLARRQTAVDVVGGGGHPDPNCSPYGANKHEEPHVGPIWEPWCDNELNDDSEDVVFNV